MSVYHGGYQDEDYEREDYREAVSMVRGVILGKRIALQDIAPLDEVAIVPDELRYSPSPSPSVTSTRQPAATNNEIVRGGGTGGGRG